MRFQKGNNLGGRTKGSRNKNKLLLDALINHFLEGGFSKFNTELNKLEGEKYVKTVLELCKLTRGRKTINEEIRSQDYLINLIKNKTKKP